MVGTAFIYDWHKDWLDWNVYYNLPDWHKDKYMNLSFFFGILKFISTWILIQKVWSALWFV